MTHARKKILLVDDTLTVTVLERAILGGGYDYLEARNGQEALDRARTERPDLILMDLNMPVMNGVEGLRRLKAEAATAHIPVVIVTTRGEEASRAECVRLGCADFLAKPIDRDLLRATVRRFVDGNGKGGGGAP
jgi:twitching motility two-component system response regulator PilH